MRQEIFWFHHELVDLICYSIFSSFFGTFIQINTRRFREHYDLFSHLLQSIEAHDLQQFIDQFIQELSYHHLNQFYCKLKPPLFFLDYNYRLSITTNSLYYLWYSYQYNHILKLFLMHFYSTWWWLYEISLIQQYPIFVNLVLHRQLSYFYHTNQFRRWIDDAM